MSGGVEVVPFKYRGWSWRYLWIARKKLWSKCSWGWCTRALGDDGVCSCNFLSPLSFMATRVWFCTLQHQGEFWWYRWFVLDKHHAYTSKYLPLLGQLQVNKGWCYTCRGWGFHIFHAIKFLADCEPSSMLLGPVRAWREISQSVMEFCLKAVGLWFLKCYRKIYGKRHVKVI